MRMIVVYASYTLSYFQLIDNILSMHVMHIFGSCQPKSKAGHVSAYIHSCTHLRRSQGDEDTIGYRHTHGQIYMLYLGGFLICNSISHMSCIYFWRIFIRITYMYYVIMYHYMQYSYLKNAPQTYHTSQSLGCGHLSSFMTFGPLV